MASIPEFDTLDEMWMDIVRDIQDNGCKMPSRDGHTREILGYTARLRDPRANFLFNPTRKASPAYAAAELIWYLSGAADIEMIKAYAPQYQRFVAGPEDDGVNAHGAYGARWYGWDGKSQREHLDEAIAPEDRKEYVAWLGEQRNPYGVGQLQALLWLLRKKPDTRQAVVTMWRPTDLIWANKGTRNDLPCTVCMIFRVQEGKLYLSVSMRSNDVWLGVPYDVYCFTSLQQIIAHYLGLELGWYQHSAMSMHVYDRNEEKAFDAAYPPAFTTGSLEYPQPIWGRFNEAISNLVDLEKWNREVIRGCTDQIRTVGEWSILGQNLVMASLKFSNSRSQFSRIHNKVMKDYCEVIYGRQ